MENTKEQLLDVLKKYANPDPKIVSTLPKGGIKLDFVGHADITKILIEVDPMWTWEPVKFDDDGLPAYRVENGMAHMAGRMTVLGVTRVAIGSAEHNKKDLLKELASDFIRNGAMRFGISLNLWTKSEWEDVDTYDKQPTRTVPNHFAPTKPAKTVQSVSTLINNVVKPAQEQPASKAHIAAVEREAREFGDPVDVCSDIIDRKLAELSELTITEVKVIINNLNGRKTK